MFSRFFLHHRNIIYHLLVFNLCNTGTVVLVILLPSSGSALQPTATDPCRVHSRQVLLCLLSVPSYKNTLDIAPFQQMNRPRAPRASRAPRANWDTPSTRLLLELAIAEKEKFNFSNQGLTRDG